METQSNANSGEDNVRGFNNEKIENLRSFLETLSSRSCSLAQSGKRLVSDTFKAKNIVFCKSWIIDSGTTDHIALSSNVIKPYKHFIDTKSVLVADGKSIRVAGHGLLI